MFLATDKTMPQGTNDQHIIRTCHTSKVQQENIKYPIYTWHFYMASYTDVELEF